MFVIVVCRAPVDVQNGEDPLGKERFVSPGGGPHKQRSVGEDASAATANSTSPPRETATKKTVLIVYRFALNALCILLLALFSMVRGPEIELLLDMRDGGLVLRTLFAALLAPFLVSRILPAAVRPGYLVHLVAGALGSAYVWDANAQPNSATLISARERPLLITGGNAGLGFAASKILLESGANVVLACRSEARCTTAARTRGLSSTRCKHRFDGWAAGRVIFQLHRQQHHSSQIKKKHGLQIAEITTTPLDLSSATSVKDAAAKLFKAHLKVDFLLLNAGFTDTPPFDAAGNTKFG